MAHNNVKRLVLAGLMMALITVTTWLGRIPIPLPIANAYIHPGDSMIYLSGYLLGGPVCAIIGGVGSAIADAVLGAYNYMFATLVIKAIMGLIAGFLLYKASASSWGRSILGMVISGGWMTLGYFLYEYFTFGIGYALPSLPFNILQWIGGIVITIPIMTIIDRIPYVQRMRKG